MRVLFLSNEHGLERSGSAYAYRLEKLRRAIEEHGIETEFLSLREQPVGRPILAQPLNVPIIRYRGTVKRAPAGYDFIHAGGNAAYTAVFLKRHTGARIIHDVHGDTVSEAQLERQSNRDLPHSKKNKSPAYRLLQAVVADTVAYRNSDYFLAVSRPLEERLICEQHIPQHRIGLVRNGVDLELFDRALGAEEAPSSSFMIGYAGGFQRWQGLDNLIAAFELLAADSVRLKIIGFTGQEAGLKADIARRLGDKVDLVDRVTQSELVSQLATVQVLIIPRPSHRAVEVAFPTKFGEYIALGKPIIVCDVDETARLVQQHSCGLVSQPNPEALAESIRAASRLSHIELRRLGLNARALAEREFSWEHIGRRYAELLTTWSSKPGDR
ncbi:MAG: glycosyltransferase family 4 protein [Chloroflexia bacterium]